MERERERVSEGGETGRETERVNEQREREREKDSKKGGERDDDGDEDDCMRESERRLLLLLTFDFKLLSPSSSLLRLSRCIDRQAKRVP